MQQATKTIMTLRFCHIKCPSFRDECAALYNQPRVTAKRKNPQMGGEKPSFGRGKSLKRPRENPHLGGGNPSRARENPRGRNGSLYDCNCTNGVVYCDRAFLRLSWPTPD